MQGIGDSKVRSTLSGQGFRFEAIIFLFVLKELV